MLNKALRILRSNGSLHNSHSRSLQKYEVTRFPLNVCLFDWSHSRRQRVWIAPILPAHLQGQSIALFSSSSPRQILQISCSSTSFVIFTCRLDRLRLFDIELCFACRLGFKMLGSLNWDSAVTIPIRVLSFLVRPWSSGSIWGGSENSVMFTWSDSLGG